MSSWRAGFALAVVAFAVPLAGRPEATGERHPARAAQRADSVKVVLAEVLFAPRVGDTAFVELANVGPRAVDLSSFVLRVDTLELPLPQLASPLAPGARVLVRFDGRGTVEGNTVHASPTFVLRAQGGEIAFLANDNRVLDRVAWGDAVDAIVPVRGGMPARVAAGSSFGRPPGANQPGANTDWVVYPPDQVTPGQPNPLPSVAQLLPLSGVILQTTTPIDLSWYPVPGAVRYRVQLSRDSAFAQAILDQTVDAPSVRSGQLAPGVYWWRVQAIPADGPPAAWSQPSRIEIEARSTGGSQEGRQSQDGGDADESESIGTARENIAPVVLIVPQIYQHKDSPMLLLESQQPGGTHGAGRKPAPPHTWDRDHRALDQKDPADNMNCGLASMAMMNSYYGGDLAQDRIGYEVFGPNVRKYASMVPASLIVFGPLRELAPGPERDLMYGYGLADEKLVAAGIYALGALPGPGSGYGPGHTKLTTLWATIVTEIDAHRPVIGGTATHFIVIRGYEVRNGRQLVYVNDPWSGPYLMDFRAGAAVAGIVEVVYTWPSHPAIARLEPEFSRDSDADSVTDFDEIHRFHTDPHNRDTDGDGVPDKQDIESGIYEQEFGLGYAWNPGPHSAGRDLDADGKPTELDPDSDNGGCKDGDEDTDASGYHDGKEPTSNFDQSDDECGPLRGKLIWALKMTNSDPNEPAKLVDQSAIILVRLKPESPGSDHYIDDSTTFSYRAFGRSEYRLDSCVVYGRQSGIGSGALNTPGAQIGATRGDDSTLVVDAQGEVTRRNSSSGGCGLPGGSTVESGPMGLNPDCKGFLDPASPKGHPTYRFNCTDAPKPSGPGWTVLAYYVRGYIRLQ